MTVPGSSSKGEDGVLSFGSLPLFGSLCHEKRCLSGKILLPLPFFELNLIGLLAMERQQQKIVEEIRGHGASYEASKEYVFFMCLMVSGRLLFWSIYKLWIAAL
jgi:hypothetical protein